jgi:hypothetical protein
VRVAVLGAVVPGQVVRLIVRPVRHPRVGSAPL